MEPVGTTAASSRSVRRKSLLASIVVGLVVVLAAGALALIVRRDEGGGRSIELPPASGDVIQVPDFEARFDPGVAATNGTLLVFGGYSSTRFPFQLLKDAVLVPDDAQTATVLTDTPFEPPLYAPTPVGVDGRFVVVGISCSVQIKESEDTDEPVCDPGALASAVLDIRDGRNEWHAIGIPEQLRDLRMAAIRGLGSTSDGRAIFSFGLLDARTYWSFDPDTDEWTSIAGPGVRAEGACLAGDTLIVLTAGYRTSGKVVEDDPMRHLEPGESGIGMLGDGFVEPTIASLDLTGDESWSRSEPAPDALYFTTAPELACMGTGVAVLDASFPRATLIYSLDAKTWTKPDASPSTGFFRDRVWTGDELVFLPTEADKVRTAMALQPDGHWRTLEDLPLVTRGAVFNAGALEGYSEPLRVGPNTPGVPTPPEGEPPTAPAGIFRYPVTTE